MHGYVWRIGLLGALAAAMAAPPAVQAASGWQPAAAMSAAHREHAAARLDDGDVLVIGGINDADGTLATTERYDVETGAWRPSGSLAVARRNATATRMHGGRVLVAGGQTDSGVTASAELYDPDTETWTTVAPMATARAFHTALFVGNAAIPRVLVAGGELADGTALASTELYDPVSDEWTDAGDMSVARTRAHMNYSYDNVEVYGGRSNDSAQPYPTTSDQFDFFPSVSWRTEYHLGPGRAQGAVVRLSDESLLLAGGVNAFGFESRSAILRARDRWWFIDDDRRLALSYAAEHTVGAALPGKRAVFAGDDTTATPVYVGYLPTRAEAVLEGFASSTLRSRPTLTALADGRALLVGGSNHATSEIFTVPTSRTVQGGEFGDVALDGSREQELLVENAGDVPLFVTSAAIAGDDAAAFSILDDRCSDSTVAVGGNCTVRLRFRPVAVGPATAELRLDDNAETSPSIALHGVAASPHVPSAPSDPEPHVPDALPVPRGPLTPLTPPGEPVSPDACATSAPVLAGVEATSVGKRPRARLVGTVARARVGERIAVLRNGRVVGQTQVRSDATVVASVAAPRAARARSAARYQLETTDGRRSAALSATRFLTAPRITGIGADRVRVSGVAATGRLTVQALAVCGGPRSPAVTARPDRNGRFASTLVAPRAGEPARDYRLRQSGGIVGLVVVPTR
ncbi:MAG: kelch repeat-containing protein [Patulibacter sp.]